MEDNSIIEIHERIYVHLIKNHSTLRFTLRQIDRGERLSKGFWFTGNDNYLAFSFWEGADWRNKTSNIFFSIDKDGTSWLNFVSNDDDENGKKSAFLKNLAESMGMFKRPKKMDDTAKQDWHKKYQEPDDIKSLDAFIKGDKKIIDTFIKAENATFFSQIEVGKFKKWQEGIEKKRAKLKNVLPAPAEANEAKTPKLVRLKEVSIENISIFKGKQSLTFHNRLTCLIGWNGSGKTSLLRAIVLGFTGFGEEESAANGNYKLAELQNLLKITGELEGSRGESKYAPSGYIDLTYNIDKYTCPPNRVSFKTVDNKPQITDEGEFKSIKGKYYETLFIAFPQKQGVGEDKNSELRPNTEDTKALLYREPDNRFQKFAMWLRKINNVSNAKKADNESNIKEQDLLKIAFEIVNRITNLSDDEAIVNNVSLHKIVVKGDFNDRIWVKIGKNTDPIPLELVSDGYNNIFGWIGYLITRLSEVADVLNIENFMDVPAIVLMDEIDTYLHTQWQSRILAVLVDMFPNIQFVVTTHSPYVVGSVPQNLMSLYVCKEGTISEFKDFTPYGADIERLTRQIFGSPVRANRVSVKIDKLRSAIQQANERDDSAHVDKLFKDLEDIGIGNDDNDNDPEIGSLKIFWRTKKRKLGI